MAGGTYLTMNKSRPGAYINFESVPKPLSSVGDRGVMTMAVPLTWGPEDKIIELYSTDLTDGNSLEKIGLTAFDDESLVFRQALSGAYLAYIYRLNTGATKATTTIGGLTVTALYGGTTGNRLEVAVIKMEGETDTFDVVIFLDGKEKDRQTVQGVGELVANAWVEFSATVADPEDPDTSKLIENAGTPLTGGTDGTAGDDDYTNYFKAIKGYKPWNTMAIVDTTSTVAPLATAFIKDMRDNLGRKVQVVVHDYTDADHEGVISVDQGYRTTTEEITKAIFPAYVAGLTAGAAINQSNTYSLVPGAVEIIGQKDDDDIPDLLQKGCFLLTRRQDGEIIVEQDINTFTSFQTDKGKEFSKNRVIRTIDGYATDIQNLFERYYIGKVDNNEDGRNTFKADVIYYLGTLQELGAIQNFDSSADIQISQGNELDEVVLDLWIQPVDSMEKLYNRVYLRGNE